MTTTSARVASVCLCAALFGFNAVPLTGAEPSRRVTVKIQDETPKVTEVDQPVDPVQRIRFTAQGANLSINDEQGRNLHLSHFPAFLVDNQMLNPFNGVQINAVETKLPKTAGGRERIGSSATFTLGDLKITRTVEVVPSKSPGPGQKRRLDSCMIRYLVENKGAQAHKVGVRAYVDAYIIDNDGAQFAAPTMPNKVIDGVELKEKTLPDYVQVLQRPDLKNPGFVAHLTLSLGSSVEKANRVVLTRHGMGFNSWEMMPAPSMGDSAFGVFWEPKELKAGGKREVAYAYGQGIAVAPESEGRFNIALGGSFEPGKIFTIAATVMDPAQGQYLALDLPPGMERVEGKEMQPVIADQEQNLILWKARVIQPGSYRVSIRSSTGLTQTKVIDISTAEK